MFRALYIAVFIVITMSFAAKAQGSTKVLKGYVMGPNFLEGVQGAHIYSRLSNRVSVSDHRGFFTISILPVDTIVISHVQYQQVKTVVKALSSDTTELMVRMKVGAIVLDNIDIHGGYKMPKYLLKKSYDPVEIPGLTRKIGPQADVAVPIGSVQYGPLSRFTKEAKEKRKLIARTKIENRDSLYVNTVTSVEFRESFMEQFGMSRHEYDEYMFYFNRRYMRRVWYSREQLTLVLYQEYLKYKEKDG